MTLGVNDPLVSRPNRNANELVIDWRMTDWMFNPAALTLNVRHAFHMKKGQVLRFVDIEG